ncbi:hypothetical protein Nocox_32935 [Nonomuraea coxensis DSM 45129]|uniref:Uncharacterized protein n=1 Tax=Nonomuraea coxensis DSM 45129 TaxID=1122611 RepID=A0ABX8UBW6_9ACTN|nr:hypothetical protein [Nonomuraea coxensis]QYC44157.1 hypothetical protein Nocox_32935 [Nonomuraea coxensis DSM 45129]
MIDFRRVTELWQRLPVTVRDAPFGMALAVASSLPALQTHGTQLGDLPARPFDGLGVRVRGGRPR